MKITIEKRVIEHGNNLNAIFHTGIDPIKLCRAVRRIEKEAEKLGEDCCNYLSMDSAEANERETRIINKLAKMGITGHGLFINFDPRGYALKIDDEYMRKNNINLHRDMGGYGIIAPDLTERKEIKT